MSRENAVGWVARRERGACPSRRRGMTSEQRRQTAYSILALRVGPLFRLSGVARRLSRNRGTGYAPSSRLGEAKKSAATRHGWVFQQSPKRELPAKPSLCCLAYLLFKICAPG